jgi:light-regulated signal transduction histidine kinase (bacteriophytochrome)
MAKKLTCEALEQRVKDLEEKALEHKQAEAKLQCRIVELERANQEVKHFAYVVSRDLQEPLDMVTNYLRFVEARYKDRLDSDAKEFIASAVDGANRMQRLITDLLAYLTRKDRAGAVVDYAKSFEGPRSN